MGTDGRRRPSGSKSTKEQRDGKQGRSTSSEGNHGLLVDLTDKIKTMLISAQELWKGEANENGRQYQGQRF
jgi:hypothetical protein